MNDNDRRNPDSDISATIAHARATAFKQGAEAERARIKTILLSEHAKGREAMAQFFAFETDVFADEAVAMLEAARLGIAPAGNLLSTAIECGRHAGNTLH